MKILVVDDELSMREYLTVLLAAEGYAVVQAATEEEGKRAVVEAAPDLVITDMKLGKGSGMAVLQHARARATPPEVIVITAYGTLEAAVEAMRHGAYDYVAKPFDNEELKLLVQRALEKRGLTQENARLRKSLGTEGVVLGPSAAMQQVWTMVQKVAASPRATVLITGESGTGKEVVARAIHRYSVRATEPFVPVNCAAIAEGVLESELFGHVKGAFTGATQDRRGILVAAGDGTVFLDEIGEVPPATQVKLLRVLQERTVRPVGASTEQPFEARVLAATNRRLDADVQSGRFREDLWYRLNVITIEVPPLRTRREDVRLLATAFLATFAEELGRPSLRFTDEALALLERFRWPGNVRQLRNVVERAATLGEGEALGAETLPAPVRGDAEAAPPGGAPTLAPGFSLEKHLDELERGYLKAALDAAGGVKTKAAQALGLSFRSFRYRLAKHGLDDDAGAS